MYVCICMCSDMHTVCIMELIRATDSSTQNDISAQLNKHDRMHGAVFNFKIFKSSNPPAGPSPT